MVATAYTQTAMQTFMRRAQQLVLTLLPPICGLCRQGHSQPTAICQRCIDSLPQNRHPCGRCAEPSHYLAGHGHCYQCRLTPPLFVSVSAPFLMTGPMQQLIHQWKFEGQTTLSTMLAALLIKHLMGQDSPRKADHLTPRYIVPIPSHWRRRWHRGFDQTWLLANNLAQLCGIPVLRGLRRTRFATAQHQLSRRERAVNMHHAFTTKCQLLGGHIVLVDDVVTTGATATAATQALLAAGADSVEVWCLARTPAPVRNQGSS